MVCEGVLVWGFVDAVVLLWPVGLEEGGGAVVLVCSA